MLLLYVWCICSLLLCAGGRAPFAVQCLIFSLHGSECIHSCISAQEKAMLIKGT